MNSYWAFRCFVCNRSLLHSEIEYFQSESFNISERSIVRDLILFLFFITTTKRPFTCANKLRVSPELKTSRNAINQHGHLNSIDMIERGSPACRPYQRRPTISPIKVPTNTFQPQSTHTTFITPFPHTHTHSIRTPNWRHPFSCIQQARDRFPVIIATVSIRNRNGLHTHNLCVASSWPSTWLSTVPQSIMLVWASIKSSRGAASHCSTLTPLTAEFFFFSVLPMSVFL